MQLQKCLVYYCVIWIADKNMSLLNSHLCCAKQKSIFILLLFY